MAPRGGDPIAVLGAGLAGLSLACAMLDAGVERDIVLVDRRRSWERDRTWCTWDTRPGLRFAEHARHRWSAWELAGGGRRIRHTTARHPYIHLDARDVYDAALERIERAASVTLRAGEAVLSVDTGSGRPVVRTESEVFTAAEVFDATGERGPLVRREPTGAIELVQGFLGWEVEVDRAVFDPATATLMDFRAPAAGGACFMYVLPFAASRALVEHTTIGPRTVPTAARRRALEAELADRCGGADWRVVHEERGRLPMTSRRFPPHRGRHVHAVGAAGGAIRPSSGYAFSRIQRQADAVAAALAAGRPLPGTVAPARYGWLDRVFLTALERAGETGGELFLRVAGAVPADSFARFMTDASSPADEARVIAALPPLQLAAAGVRTGVSELVRRGASRAG